MRDWRSEVRARLAGARLEAEVEAEIVEELGQHLDDRFRELCAEGMSADAAERAVLLELCNQDSLEDALRGVRPGRDRAPVLGAAEGRRWHGIWKDVQYAVRAVRLSPAFSLAAVLALGLGVGAATAVFSLLDGVVLRPLPYQQPDRLAMIWETNTEKSLEREPVSPVNLLDYRRLTRVFSDVAAWWRPEINLADETGEPMRVSTVETSENLFRVLGIRAAVGRTFPLDSTLHGSEPEVVISDRLWRTRFSADRNVVGRQVRMNGQALTVVGVMPPGFHFPEDTDAWQRLSWDLAQHNRGAHFMGSVARLRPNTPIEAANAELAALSRRLQSEFPQTNGSTGARAVPLSLDVAGVFRPGLFALFGAAGLLLLIACINVANLLLARSMARQGEVAVRSALGASRVRLLRQFLVESVVLAAGGTVVGVLVASTAVRAFLAWTPIEIPRADEVGVNLSVLGFSVLVTALTTIVFGLAPALLSSRANLQMALKEAGRSTSTRLGQRVRGLLVISEVALAVALLAGAGLLIRTVDALMDEDTGVHAGAAVSVDLQLPLAGFTDADWSAVEAFYAQLLPALRARPEIRRAGASNFLPLEAGWRMPFQVEGAVPARPGELPLAQFHSVDESYLRTIGVRLLAGRYFDERDDATAPGVIVVNETFARQQWPGQNAVGKRVNTYARGVGPLGRRLLTDNQHEVVGVVADVKNTSIKAAAEAAIYTSARQFPFRRMFIVAEGASAAALVSAIRQEVQQLDPSLPLGEARSMERVLAAAADPPRFVMLVLTVFAALALLLSGVGIYGLLSYSVSQRARELSVRMALGARPADVMRLVVSKGLLLAAGGAVLGVGAALIGVRFLAGMLYGVTPGDPLTLGSVVLVVLSVGLLACALPGRRAALSDPMDVLRR